MSLIDLANPTRFLALVQRVLPWLAMIDGAGAAARPRARGERARRLPARRDREDHVHSRAQCLALDVRLGRDERRGARHAGVATSARRRRAKGRSAARRLLHVSRARHRFAVGPADVGHLLGMGRAHDLGAGAVPALSRHHRAVARGRRSRTRRPRRRDPDAGRRDQHPDHQVLGRLVEHAAPAGVGVPPRRTDHRIVAALSAAGDGQSPSCCCSSRCCSRPCATRSCGAGSARCS